MLDPDQSWNSVGRWDPAETDIDAAQSKPSVQVWPGIAPLADALSGISSRVSGTECSKASRRLRETVCDLRSAMMYPGVAGGWHGFRSLFARAASSFSSHPSRSTEGLSSGLASSDRGSRLIAIDNGVDMVLSIIKYYLLPLL